MISLRGLVAATGAAIGLLAASAQALPPVLDRVPADALVVIATPSLDRLEKGSAALTGALNLPLPIPSLNDAMSMAGFDQGVDSSKSAAIVLLAGDMDAEVPPMVILLPTDNYADLVGNFGEAAAGVTEVLINGEPAYFRDIGGGYALMSPMKALAEGFDGKAGNAQAHQTALGESNRAIADNADLLIIANIEAIRPLAEPKLDAMFEEMMAATPLAMMGPGVANMEGAKESLTAFLRQGRTAVIGLKADGAGLSIDLGAQFIEGSALAETFARGGDAGSLLGKLPKQPYYLAVAADLTTPGMKRILKGMMELNKRQMEEMAGEDAPPAMMMMAPEELDGMAAMVGASPGAMMGAGVLVNTVTYSKTPDPAGMIAKMRESMAALDGSEFQGMTYTATYTQGATTVGGTAVDGWDIKIGGAEMNNPQVAQTMAMIFGPAGGPSGYVAAADGGVIQTYSKNSVLMGAALNAAKNPGAGLGSDATVSQVAERLPGNRLVEGYVGMKSILDMVKMVGAMFGAPPVDVPADLPPVGFAVAGSGGASRVSVFVPAPVLRTTSNIIQAFQEAGQDDFEEDAPAPKNRTGQPRF